MILIFQLILIVLILLCLFFCNKSENFTDVIIESDYYIPSINSIKDNSGTPNLGKQKINASRICIFKLAIPPQKTVSSNNPTLSTSDTPEEVDDVECIDINTLLPILNLPKERKDTICLDGNCLNKDDILFLRGEEEFQLSSRSEIEGYNSNCLGGDHKLKLRQCGTNINPSDQESEKIEVFHPVGCNEGNAWKYTLRQGLNQDKNLNRQTPSQQYVPIRNPQGIPFEEGHG